MVQGGGEAQKVSRSFLCSSAGYGDPSKGGSVFLKAPVQQLRGVGGTCLKSSTAPFFPPQTPLFRDRKSPGTVLPMNPPQQPGRESSSAASCPQGNMGCETPGARGAFGRPSCSLWERPGTDGRCGGTAQAVSAALLGFLGFCEPWRKLSHTGSSAGAWSVCPSPVLVSLCCREGSGSSSSPAQAPPPSAPSPAFSELFHPALSRTKPGACAIKNPPHLPSSYF